MPFPAYSHRVDDAPAIRGDRVKATPAAAELWAGLAAAIYVLAFVVAWATPQINPTQKKGSAWLVNLGPLTFDLSPWTLDVPLRYRPRSVHAVLQGWGVFGRELAFWLHLSLDLVFPLAYAVALWMAIGLAAEPVAISARLLTALQVLPFAAAIPDWAENFTIVWLVRRYPDQPPARTPTALWVISGTKWLLLLISIGVLVILSEGALNPVLAGWGVPKPQLAGWQPFYTATAGGSAAILGLFYVAQSIQPPTAVRHQAGRRHVAVTSTLTTVMILLISLSALWAQQSPRAFGAISIALIAGYAAISLWHQRYVGENLRYQRWRRARVAGAWIALTVIVLGGTGAVEASRAGLPLIAVGVMLSFALWAITALALLYPQPDSVSRAVHT